MLSTPKHIAIILDGNNRWAKERNLPCEEGHKQGVITLENIMDYLYEIGVPIVTLYAFSSENWKRSQEEINILFDLLRNFLDHQVSRLIQKNTRLKIIGDFNKFPDDIVQNIHLQEENSKQNHKFLLQIGLNYGGKDEIIRGMKKAISAINKKEITLDDIDEDSFKHYLDTHLSENDPDILIRTGGDMRISNFLLYQLAYTEFFFTKTNWPDFSTAELDNIIIAYNKRERRFGGRL